MNTLSISSSLLFVFLVINLSCFLPSHSQSQNGFFQCLDKGGVSGLIYTPSNSSYLHILNISIDNRRFASPSTNKPFIIVTPELESHIQTVVLCSKEYGIQIRTRSGGHDFEGISYRSVKAEPFVLLDLFKMNKITIDASQKTAWVQAGATLGQLYYKISTVSQTLAFPGGFCPTVGVGGHFSGGGYGQLFREYGLASDNVIDARLINVDGNVLDGDNMGSDLFWAIRGGGGGSFGIVTAWKVNLVYVPQVLTYFTVNRTLEQNVTELVHKWQHVAPYFPKDIYFAVTLKSVISSVEPSGKTIQATFVAIANGGVDEFLALLAKRFPELGASRQDCRELSWVQSLLVFNGYPADTPPKLLASRIQPVVRPAYKRKSDYIQEPITYSGLEGIWNYLYEVDIMDMLFVASGGMMYEIPASATPYAHRAGYLFGTLYAVTWEAEVETPYASISLFDQFYQYMARYASKSPRGAYVNYRDLDLGINGEGTQIPTWGFQYFGRNFIKLMEVKTEVDPGNFFRDEQSIPTIPLFGERMKQNSNLLKAIS